MGKHTNSYVLVANMRGKEMPLYPVYGLERAETLANRLRRYHPVSIRDSVTGAIVANAVEVVPFEIVSL